MVDNRIKKNDFLLRDTTLDMEERGQKKTTASASLKKSLFVEVIS